MHVAGDVAVPGEKKRPVELAHRVQKSPVKPSAHCAWVSLPPRQPLLTPGHLRMSLDPDERRKKPGAMGSVSSRTPAWVQAVPDEHGLQVGAAPCAFDLLTK